MTIFRKVVETFLIEGIDRIQSISIGQDNGLINTIGQFTLFFQRQTDLSSAKRERLDVLKAQIKELLETSHTDAGELKDIDNTTKEALLGLITTCKHELLALCTTKKISTGQTEIALADLEKFVGAAHEKICIYLQLADLPINNKEINNLKYYAGLSCGRSVFEQEVIPADTRLVLSPEKEAIILNTLTFAIEINKATREYLMLRPPLMQERAEYIQREAQKIDSHASNQYLIEYMDRAITSFVPVSKLASNPDIDPALLSADSNQYSSFSASGAHSPGFK